MKAINSFFSGTRGIITVLIIGILASLLQAALSHNFGLADSPAGIGPYGAQAVIPGILFCLFIGFTMRKQIS